FKYVKFYTDLKLREKQLELAKRKFEQRCAEALRKHELALQRLQRARERDRQRADARAVRAAQRAAARPAPPPGPGGQKPAPPDQVRRLPTDPAATLQALSAQFSADELAEAGVAVASTDNLLALDGGLLPPNEIMFALRTRPDQCPYEILIEEGGVSRQALPA